MMILQWVFEWPSALLGGNFGAHGNTGPLF